MNQSWFSIVIPARSHHISNYMKHIQCSKQLFSLLLLIDHNIRMSLLSSPTLISTTTQAFPQSISYFKSAASPSQITKISKSKTSMETSVYALSISTAMQTVKATMHNLRKIVIP